MGKARCAVSWISLEKKNNNREALNGNAYMWLCRRTNRYEWRVVLSLWYLFSTRFVQKAVGQVSGCCWLVLVVCCLRSLGMGFRRLLVTTPVLEFRLLCFFCCWSTYVVNIIALIHFSCSFSPQYSLSAPHYSLSVTDDQWEPRVWELVQAGKLMN